MRFAEVKKSKKPGRVVKVTPDFFEATWKDRPGVDVAVGLRLLSVREIADCRAEAKREATAFYDEQPREGGSETFVQDIGVELFNEVLLCEALARSLTDPNDVTRPYFDQATITIRSALTSEGLRRLWDEYMILSAGSGITMVAASDTELALLGKVLRSELGRRVLDDEARKLCAYVLDKAKGAMPDTPDLEEIDMENELLDLIIDDAEDAEEQGGAGGFVSGEESVHHARSQ